MLTLIWPPQNELHDPWGYPPQGLLFLSSYLEENKIENRILNLAGYDRDTTSSWEPLIEDSEVFGISITTPLYSSAKKVIDVIKEKYPNRKIVIGGMHPSLLPKDAREELKPNYTVIGDGEKALLNIMNGEEKEGVIDATSKEYLIPLTSLPIPNRNNLKYDWVCTTDLHGATDVRSTTVITSRGCPFSCSYCCQFEGKKVRYRSPEQVYEELLYLKTSFGIQHIRFVDDVFTLNRQRLVDICRKIQKLNMTWLSITRADLITKDMLFLMQDSGNTELCFGVESGSKEQLKRMNKRESVEKIIKAINMCKEVGVKTKVFLLFGFPGEDKNTVKDTMEFMKKAKPDKYTMSTFVPLPGSNVFKNPKKYGVNIVNRNWEDYWFYWELGERKGYFIEYPNQEEIYTLRDELKLFLQSEEWKK
jgi:radical SAM superfamily enzyme YgiQ (UPF0313 family)